MPAAGIISTGNTYRLFDSSVKTHRDLPVGTYSVQFSQFSGYSLQKVDDLEVGAERIYGNHAAKIDRTLKAYGSTDRSLGVLFSGDKGMGKSLSLRMLAQRAQTDLGLPVIKVENDSPGLADYLDELGEAVVVFDEFEKNFEHRGEDGNRQEQFLGLFDGVSTAKRMYVISANKVGDLSDYLVNRPGRFHYHIRHDYPGPDEVREYLRDEVPGIDSDEVEEIVAFTRKTKINYDHLRAITFELNLGGTFRDTIGDINIKKFEDPLYTAIVSFPGGQKDRRTVRFDPFAEDDTTLSVRHPDGTDVVITIDQSKTFVTGDALAADLNGISADVPMYEDEEKQGNPAYMPTSVTLELLGQKSYAY